MVAWWPSGGGACSGVAHMRRLDLETAGASSGPLGKAAREKLFHLRAVSGSSHLPQPVTSLPSLSATIAEQQK